MPISSYYTKRSFVATKEQYLPTTEKDLDLYNDATCLLYSERDSKYISPLLESKELYRRLLSPNLDKIPLDNVRNLFSRIYSKLVSLASPIDSPRWINQIYSIGVSRNLVILPERKSQVSVLDCRLSFKRRVDVNLLLIIVVLSRIFSLLIEDAKSSRLIEEVEGAKSIESVIYNIMLLQLAKSQRIRQLYIIKTKRNNLRLYVRRGNKLQKIIYKFGLGILLYNKIQQVITNAINKRLIFLGI